MDQRMYGRDVNGNSKIEKLEIVQRVAHDLHLYVQLLPYFECQKRKVYYLFQKTYGRT
jgi:hypothetical protein